MQKSKLVQILQLLSRSELLALQYYVRGCCAVQRTLAGELLEVLLVFIKKDAEIDKKKIFAKIWGKTTPYNVNLLGRYMHELLAMLEDFIVLHEAKKQRVAYHFALTQFYTTRGNLHLATTYFEETKEQLEAQKQRDIAYFQTKLSLEQHAILLRELQHENIFAYQPLIETLYTGFLAEMLLQHCRLQNEYLANKSALPQDSLLSDVLAYIDRMPSVLETPVVAVYFHLYKVLSDYSLENYTNFKTIFISQQHLFAAEEVSKLYAFLENSFVAQAAQNKVNYSELFDLYKTGYENAFIFDIGGSISIGRLQNAVTVALRADETDWALSFLNNCKMRIAEDSREEVFQVNLANIRFQQGQFSAVQQALADIKYTTIAYQLTARRLQIKVYYMTENDTALELALNAYKKFLYATKKTITENYKNNNLAFVRTVRRLFELRELPKRSRSKAVEKICLEIASEKLVAERPWLAKQAELLR